MLLYLLNRHKPDRGPALRVSRSVSPVRRRPAHVPSRARLTPGPGRNRPVRFADSTGSAAVQTERSAAIMWAKHRRGSVTENERSRRARPGGRAAPAWRPVG
jgi:hypothetical protein